MSGAAHGRRMPSSKDVWVFGEAHGRHWSLPTPTVSTHGISPSTAGTQQVPLRAPFSSPFCWRGGRWMQRGPRGISAGSALPRRTPQVTCCGPDQKGLPQASGPLSLYSGRGFPGHRTARRASPSRGSTQLSTQEGAQCAPTVRFQYCRWVVARPADAGAA